MDPIDRNTIQRSAAYFAEDLKLHSPESAAGELAFYDSAEAAATLQKLAPAFAVEVLSHLHPVKRERALAEVPSEVARQWQRNALYEEGTIGRMMEPVYAVFPPEAAVGEVTESLKELVKRALITYIYVVDEDGRLLGIVTMRDLLFNEPTQHLRDVMLTNAFALDASLPLEEAMKQVLNRHYPAYPVVDDERRVQGLVRGQSLFEARAFEISAQPGTMVGVDKEERLATPWQRSLIMRHPWLQLNLLTAFLAAAVVGFFQETVDKLVILALFLPVLAGQSGNTGCQALAVTLRAMTIGEFRSGNVRRLISKEAGLGALNGAGVGVMAAIGMYVTATTQHSTDAVWLSIVVFLAMVASCMVSGLSGALVPLTLKRLGFDPATASSIFLTTATDVVSMGLLLGLATVLIL